MATGTRDSDDDEVPPEPVIDDLLADDCRKHLLRILCERDEPMVVDDLAAAVCAIEAGPDGRAIDEERRRSTRTEMFEKHLPKLTAIDAVHYDSMVGTVEYVGAGELCERLDV